MVYIAQDNPVAAINLDLEFEARAGKLHAAQQWP